MLTCVFALVTTLITGQVIAADKWLQKRDPEELYAYVDTNLCPLSTSDVTEMVHSQLIRSRIKPLTKWDSGEIALYIALDCAARNEASWVFDLTVMLAKLKKEASNIVVSFRHEDQFGQLELDVAKRRTDGL